MGPRPHLFASALIMIFSQIVGGCGSTDIGDPKFLQDESAPPANDDADDSEDESAPPAVVDNDNDGRINAADCDDNDAEVHADAPEICDGKDNNCDGLIDEGFATTVQYLDADGDGHAGQTSRTTCLPLGNRWLATSTDCNDHDVSIFPGNDVEGDGKDNDCDEDPQDGAPGADGRDGQDGAPGADGNDGQNGQDGADGPQGPQGEPGADGQDGVDGADGADGADGNDGRDGQNGSNGINCWDINGNGQNDQDEDTNGDDQFTALDCQGPAGNDGQNGQDGADGVDGVDGAPGQNGRDGRDGVVDNDGDGRVGVADCDDNDASVFDGAPEICGDGIDQNCDGQDDVCPPPPQSQPTIIMVSWQDPLPAIQLNVELVMDPADVGRSWPDINTALNSRAVSVGIPDSADRPLMDVCAIRVNVTKWTDPADVDNGNVVGEPNGWLCEGAGASARIDATASIAVSHLEVAYTKAHFGTWSPTPNDPAGGCSALLALKPACEDLLD